MKAVLPALFVAALLSVPSATACHPDPCNPECFAPGIEECHFEPPFGVLPFVLACAGVALDVAGFFAAYGLATAVWGVQTANEVIFGC